jgi:mRNA-degrading endonuclease RelE of RelBE toxin-antitoxin system
MAKMWNVAITGPAQKDFQKLPQKDKARIEAALASFQADPFQGDLKRLKGKLSGWRRRIGSFRIIFDADFEKRQIVVSGILRRTSTTYE